MTNNNQDKDHKDLVEDLKFLLRDWDGKNRFHFVDASALLIDKAATTIKALQERVVELEAVLAANEHSISLEIDRSESDISNTSRYLFYATICDPRLIFSERRLPTEFERNGDFMKNYFAGEMAAVLADQVRKELEPKIIEALAKAED